MYSLGAVIYSQFLFTIYTAPVLTYFRRYILLSRPVRIPFLSPLCPLCSLSFRPSPIQLCSGRKKKNTLHRMMPRSRIELVLLASLLMQRAGADHPPRGLFLLPDYPLSECKKKAPAGSFGELWTRRLLYVVFAWDSSSYYDIYNVFSHKLYQVNDSCQWSTSALCQLKGRYMHCTSSIPERVIAWLNSISFFFFFWRCTVAPVDWRPELRRWV
jgi:hypothetical protein